MFAQEVTDDGPNAWEDESFNMRFAFFSRTSADVRLRILEGRRSRLQERLDRQRHAAGGDDRYLSELRRHAIESVEREVRWLTDLINAERGPDNGPTSTASATANPPPEVHRPRRRRPKRRRHAVKEGRPPWDRFE